MSLNQLFDAFVGGNSGQSSNNQGNSQSGLSALAGQVPGGLVGGLAAGGLLGALVGNKKMRKKAKKMAGSAVGIGGGALIGAVAFNAYKNWQANNASGSTIEAPAPKTPISSGGGIVPIQPLSAPAKLDASAFDPSNQQDSEGQPFQVSLIKAMISSANADGHIDSKEQAAIFDAVNKMELEPADKALVFDTLQNPPSVETIASYANGLEQASELYLVSNLAIDPDDPREREYLDRLAEKLALPKDLAAHLENQVNGQAHAAV